MRSDDVKNVTALLFSTFNGNKEHQHFFPPIIMEENELRDIFVILHLDIITVIKFRKSSILGRVWYPGYIKPRGAWLISNTPEGGLLENGDVFTKS